MTILRKYCFTIFLALLAESCAGPAQQSDIILEGRGIVARNGMVVSAKREASGIGVEILIKGGNAVDAAVATGFALAVCYPEAGNIGGGGFMVIRLADGNCDVLDYREKAPGSATRNMYLDASGNVIDGSSTDTHLASGVPGSVDGLIEAHRKYGKLPFSQIIQPAIDLAENGYILTAEQANSLNLARKDFIDRNLKVPALAGRSPWKEGDVLRQRELAATLRLIRDKGRDGFYAGKVASLIINEMSRGHGIISQKDLDEYRSVWRKPLEGEYHGFTIITAPPPSGGGITLLQILNMIGPRDLKSPEFHSAGNIHLIIEAERRAFADRSFFAGDPDFTTIPVNKMLDPKYLSERMSDFRSDRASLSVDISHGSPEKPVPEETTHYSVVDSEGNAVSTTTTLNGTFGNCIVVEGAGFLLNNEMDDFSVKPGFPNMYGLTGGEANSIAPGKRMLSSMTPSIVLKNGKIFMVVGSPGGSTIPTTVLQVILNVTDWGMNIQSAVDAGRFHHQWMPDVVYTENAAIDSVTVLKLVSMGHRFKTRGPIGSANSIMKLKDGSLQGGADPRGNNIAAGY
ncbi:MAG: gamma-glutamyltransferase [Bacteroidales bacterium]|jgi:gamma-glutamyltranspeptidase/glutathione hydrolase